MTLVAESSRVTTMKLIYTKSFGTEIKAGDEVKRGDQVLTRSGDLVTVAYFAKPHKPNSEGKVSLREPNSEWDREYYVSVIDAEWTDREDRVGWKPVNS